MIAITFTLGNSHMRRSLLFFITCAILFLQLGCSKEDNTDQPASPDNSVRDIDGNRYNTVTIGDQVWMAENLRTTRYRDGRDIPEVTDNGSWTTLDSGAWCHQNNDPGNESLHGRLYNWFAASDEYICPQGWHIPTETEWQTLEMELGMPSEQLNWVGFERGADENIGGKLKSTELWVPPNLGATNETGFNALPIMARFYFNGEFDVMGYVGIWWSSSESSSNNAWERVLNQYSSGIFREGKDKRNGYCLRCLNN
jgi:uncharacterized protein (TIGR02145 family)